MSNGNLLEAYTPPFAKLLTLLQMIHLGIRHLTLALIDTIIN